MPSPEGAPLKMGVLEHGVPNESTPDEIRRYTQVIGDHLFEGLAIDEASFLVIGTIVQVRVGILSVRDYRPRAELVPEQLEARTMVEEYFHDFHFEGRENE